MTTPTTDPTPRTEAPPAHPAPHGLLHATAIIATIGVVVALLGVALMLRPVTTPTQDCGTSLGFLLDGRVDELVSPTDPPKGITPAEAKANNAEPCRARVADRTKPAAVLFGAGLLAAIGAAIVEMSVRLSGWLQRRRVRRSQAALADRSAPTPGTVAPGEHPPAAI